MSFAWSLFYCCCIEFVYVSALGKSGVPAKLAEAVSYEHYLKAVVTAEEALARTRYAFGKNRIYSILLSP